MTRAEHAKKIADQAQKRGLPIPESALPPDLDPYLAEYVSHFWELSTDRALGYAGVGPIPWRALDQYAERLGITDDDVLYEDFRSAITALDEEYLLVQAEQIKARMGSKPGAAAGATEGSNRRGSTTKRRT